MAARRSRFSEADRERFAEQRKAELDTMHQRLSDGVNALVNGDEWQAWLQVAARFHAYSFRNTLLIYLQDPEATAVAGYKAWQTAFGRQVNKGEKGIRILAPILARTEATDRDGKPILDANGKRERRASIVGVKPTSVFDVRQTSGPPLAERPRPQLLRGQAPEGLWDKLTTFIEAHGYTVHRGDCGTANGVIRFDDKTITIRPDIDDAAALKSLCHETGHLLLHAPPPDQTLRVEVPCRGVAEVEAESVAFLLSHAYGVDSSQYTFAYVAGWAEQALTTDTTLEDVIAQTGSRVISAAHKILDATQPEPALDVNEQLAVEVKAQIVHDRQARESAGPAPQTAWQAAFPAVATTRTQTAAGQRPMRRPNQPTGRLQGVER